MSLKDDIEEIFNRIEKIEILFRDSMQSMREKIEHLDQHKNHQINQNRKISELIDTIEMKLHSMELYNASILDCTTEYDRKIKAWSLITSQGLDHCLDLFKNVLKRIEKLEIDHDNERSLTLFI